MTENNEPEQRPRRILKGFVLVLTVIIFLPLIFQDQFRELIAIGLLGISYSLFLVSTWKRWIRRADRFNRDWLGGVVPLRGLRYVLTLLPLKAWGVVPFVIQLLVVGVITVCGWFLGPVIYNVLRNPATPGIVREALQNTAPELFRFLNAIASNQNPAVIARENAQQIFTNLNRFVSAFVFPVIFVVFTSVGASLHRSIERLFRRAEGREDQPYSKILNNYSLLFSEYIGFNLIYYLILSVVLGGVLTGFEVFGVATFDWKLIAGILVTFVAGNIVIPGFGTFAMTGLVVGILFSDAGMLYAGSFLVACTVYFVLDDYFIKPMFLVWMGGSPGRNWEFGAEIIIVGLGVLYSAFGLIGVLLLFPTLCFLSAYLRDQFPEVRPWVLQPIQHLQE